MDLEKCIPGYCERCEKWGMLASGPEKPCVDCVERDLLLAIRTKAVDMDLGNESTVMALWAAVDAYDEAMKRIP